MTPEQAGAWAEVIVKLASVGVQVANLIHGWITQAHPNLTPEQTHAAYQALMARDDVIEALAKQAAGLA